MKKKCTDYRAEQGEFSGPCLSMHLAGESNRKLTYLSTTNIWLWKGHTYPTKDVGSPFHPRSRSTINFRHTVLLKIYCIVKLLKIYSKITCNHLYEWTKQPTTHSFSYLLFSFSLYLPCATTIYLGIFFNPAIFCSVQKNIFI